MLYALVIITILIISGIFRVYFRHKYDVTSHIEEVERAGQRHEKITKKAGYNHSWWA